LAPSVVVMNCGSSDRFEAAARGCGRIRIPDQATPKGDSHGELLQQMRIAGQRRVLQQVRSGCIGSTTCGHSKPTATSGRQILQHLWNSGDGSVLQQVRGGHTRAKPATRGSAGAGFRHADASRVNAD
jgi:hypothetical protein